MNIKSLQINAKHTKYKLLGIGLLFLFLNWRCTSIQEKTLPQDPNLIHGQLDNGFQYYIKKVDDESMKGEVSMGLYGRMGTWLEKEEQRGLAHLIEHMVAMTGNSCVNADWFYAEKHHTPKHPATTKLSSVEYHFNLRDPKYIGEYLQVLRCYSQDSVLQQNLIDTILVRKYGRTSVLGEVKGRDWEQLISKSHLYLKMFGQPFHMEAEKEIRNIKQFDVLDLADYYSEWYRPDMQALYIIGDIPEVALVEQNIRKLFSDLKVPQNAKKPFFSQWLDKRKALLPGTLRVVTVKDNYKPIGQAGIYLAGPSPLLKNIDNSEKQLKNQWLQDLYREILGKRLGKSEISSHFKGVHYNYPEITGIGGAYFFDIGFSLPINDGKDILLLTQQIYTELERMARYGVSSLELVETKRMLLKRAINNSNDLGASYRNKILNHFLYGDPMISPENQIALDTIVLTQIDNTSIQDYARQIMELPDQVLGIRMSNENPIDYIPNDTEFKAIVEAIKKDTTIQPISNEIPSDLLSLKQQNALASDVTYTSCQSDQESVQCLVLENGLRIVFQPNPGNGEITLKVQSTLKPSDYARIRDQIAAYAASLVISQSGAGSWNGEVLQNYCRLNDIKYNFSLPLELNSSPAIISEAPLEKTESLLQLLYLYLGDPKVDKNWKSKLISHSTQNYRISNAFDQTISNLFGEPNRKGLRNPLNAQALEQIKEADVLSRFRELYSPNRLTIAITGDFSMENLRPLLQRYLGHIPQVNMAQEIQGNTKMEKPSNTKLYTSEIDSTIYSQTKKGKLQFRWQLTGIPMQKKEMVAWEILRTILQRDLFQIARKNYIGAYVSLESKQNENMDFVIEYNTNTDHILEELHEIEYLIREEVSDLTKLIMDERKVKSAKNDLKMMYGKSSPAESNKNRVEYMMEIALGVKGNMREAQDKMALLNDISEKELQDIIKQFEKTPMHVLRHYPKELK